MLIQREVLLFILHIDFCKCRLSFNKLTNDGVSLLLNALRENNSSISKIFLEKDNITDTCMPSLGEFIQDNPSVQEVFVGHNKISDSGIETLLPYMIGNTELRVIGFDACVLITDKSIPLLIKMIESSSLCLVITAATSITQENLLIAPLIHNVLSTGWDMLDISNR